MLDKKATVQLSLSCFAVALMDLCTTQHIALGSTKDCYDIKQVGAAQGMLCAVQQRRAHVMLAGAHCTPQMLDPGAAATAAMRCLAKANLKRSFRLVRAAQPSEEFGARKATC